MEICEILPVPAAPAAVLPAVRNSAAETDAQLVEMWLQRSRSAETRRGYKRDVGRFFLFLQGRPLGAVSLADVQTFGLQLEGASASRHRCLSAIKSLLSFAADVHYLPLNVGAGVPLPTVKGTLAERILDEPEVQRMLALEPDIRNRAILTLLYGAGVRRSELVGISGRDLKKRSVGGQVTVLGKGGKTRVIVVSKGTWKLLGELGAVEADAPLFRSQLGRRLSGVQVWRIVKAAAERAGLSEAVSTHWLRHAHASHALDRGAPISLVQQTLGHASVSTTGRYLHARPSESSSKFLPV